MSKRDFYRAAPFDASLMALCGVSGLGRTGIEALSVAFENDLSRVWWSSTTELHRILSAAKVPSAALVVSHLRADPSLLIMCGRCRVEELAERQVAILSRQQFPNSLLEIPDPPHWLFVEGDAAALNRKPMVAVVGTREPSDLGVKAAARVVGIMSAYPITVISGLAEGIDTAAHKAALQNKLVNIAFLGHGIDMVFPASTADLRKRVVAEGGAVVSEYLPHEQCQKRYFVQRNRLQAALADVVVPVEAKLQGGTAHTVCFATDYKRPVVGIQWTGSGGLSHQLKGEGRIVTRIYTAKGRKQLDHIFQKLMEVRFLSMGKCLDSYDS